jgi:hypothetical protein
MISTYLTIFAAGFVSVFALGFQSRNVNHGNYRWAAGTSFIVGSTSAFLWSHITQPGVGAIGGIVYGLSGSLAITLSMYVHERFIQRVIRE